MCLIRCLADLKLQVSPDWAIFKSFGDNFYNKRSWTILLCHKLNNSFNRYFLFHSWKIGLLVIPSSGPTACFHHCLLVQHIWQCSLTWKFVFTIIFNVFVINVVQTFCPHLQPFWPDWEIFKGLGDRFSFKSSPNTWILFGLI